MRSGDDGSARAICAKCAHYFITHEPRFPYGCHAMGFKSRRAPQQEIVAVTGGGCLAYAPRAMRRVTRS